MTVAGPQPLSRARLAASNLFLALVSTAVLLGLLEGAAYVAGVTPRFSDQAYLGSIRMRDCRYMFHKARGTCAAKWLVRTGPHLVVALGGSTVMGWPPGKTVPFPNQLQTLLDAAYPGKYTIANRGLMCKDSIYVRQCAEAAIGAHPDVLIVYTGENSFSNWGFADPERAIFLEENAWLYELDKLLSRTRVYSVIARKLERPVPIAAWVDAQLPDDRFDHSRQIILAKYRSDVSRVIEVAREQGTEVLLVTQASNLYEFPIRKEAWDAPRVPAKPGTRTARWGEHFWKGVELFRAERFDDALAEFKQARDINPGGRSPSQLNDVVRELAAEADHVHLVDFERELERVGIREGIGCNFFGHDDNCDQFHTNTRTNHLIAQSLFRAIEELKLPERRGALGRTP
jgi:lysophospholipase L1-like esterase